MDEPAQCVCEIVRGDASAECLFQAVRGAEDGGDVPQQRYRPRPVGVGDGQVEGDVERGVLGRTQFPLQHGAGEAGDQQQTALADLGRPVLGCDRRGTRGSVEGIEASGKAGSERDALTAQRLRDRRPLTLRVAGDVDAVSVRDRPRGDRLRERALAHPDDAGQHRVGVGEPLDPAAGVQRERVVAERGLRVHVTADEDPLGAETAFGEEGVGAGRGRGGQPVRRQPHLPAARRCRTGTARCGEHRLQFRVRTCGFTGTAGVLGLAGAVASGRVGGACGLAVGPAAPARGEQGGRGGAVHRGSLWVRRSAGVVRRRMRRSASW
ncbi:hypothetical protein a10_09535 [Streptomyces acidiscabies]|nr:hypothetical protein a10_09535 [Streptomyces acidiscabies]